MMEEMYNAQCLQGELATKSKRIVNSNIKKKSADEDPNKAKDKGEKRAKKRKGSDSNKKLKKEDPGEPKALNVSRHSSDTPDSEPRQDQSDSPMIDDVFEGSNSSQESSEMLSMSSLLISVLDRKKELLLESDEVQQFFMERLVKKENWSDSGN